MNEKIPKIVWIMFFLIYGLSSFAQQTVTVFSKPIISAGPDIPVSLGQSVQPVVITDDPGTYNYKWTGPGGFISTAKQPNLSTLGTYTFQATNISGCFSVDNLLLRALSPTDTFWFSFPVVCQSSDTILLDKYVSYPGDGTFSGLGVVDRYFVPSHSGIITLSWDMGNKIVTTNVTVYPAPDIKVYKDTLIRCLNDSGWLSAIGTADIYKWSLLNNPSKILAYTKDYKIKVVNQSDYLLIAGTNYAGITCYTKDTMQVVPAPVSSDFTYSIDKNKVDFVPIAGATSYLWTFGDGSTSTTASPTKIYEENGYFDVSLQIGTMCSTKKYTTTKSILIIELFYKVGIDDVVSNNIKIYPNPTSDFIRLDGIESFSTIQIIDTKGNIITNTTIDNQETLQVDVSSYPLGIYFVTIIGKNGGVYTAKLIKK